MYGFNLMIMDKQNWGRTFLFASAMDPEGILSDNGPFGSGKAVEIYNYIHT